MTRTRIKFYSKPDCPLCDAGLLIVGKLARRFDLDIEKIDIETDSRFIEKFGDKIPVVELDGDILSFGKLSERELAQAIGDRTGTGGLLHRLGLRR